MISIVLHSSSAANRISDNKCLTQENILFSGQDEKLLVREISTQTIIRGNTVYTVNKLWTCS